jgi:hypothetical protein
MRGVGFSSESILSILSIFLLAAAAAQAGRRDL